MSHTIITPLTLDHVIFNFWAIEGGGVTRVVISCVSSPRSRACSNSRGTYDREKGAKVQTSEINRNEQINGFPVN